jgi:hypothetical protein
MDTERNLLFGALALQIGLIDADQFVEVCKLWSARKTVPLNALLIRCGWIQPTDADYLEYLLERMLERCGGKVRDNLEQEANVRRWCGQRGLTLRITNERHHWQMTDGCSWPNRGHRAQNS